MMRLLQEVPNCLLVIDQLMGENHPWNNISISCGEWRPYLGTILIEMRAPYDHRVCLELKTNAIRKYVELPRRRFVLLLVQWVRFRPLFKICFGFNTNIQRRVVRSYACCLTSDEIHMVVRALRSVNASLNWDSLRLNGSIMRRVNS